VLREALLAGAATALLSGATAAQTVPVTPGPVAVPETTLAPIDVISTSPLSGIGIDRDKVPGTVQTLTSGDFQRTGSPVVTDTLFQRIPGVTLSDPNGNNAEQALGYRGFSASPLQGTPQGIAVYMNGIRFNEAFGDTVNWDLIPTNAIDRTDLWTNNPVFGLNALGGAINLQMKNGFNYQGSETEAEGGSFGHFSGGTQYGIQVGDYSAYFAAQGSHDEGWRFQSPSDLMRGYADVGWKNNGAEVHLIAQAASSSFGVAAATPIQLLDLDDRAIYTTPQTTQNQMGLVGLNGSYELTDTWSLQGNVYVRGFRQWHIDGNAADTERCSRNSDPQFVNHLCLQDDGFPAPSPVTAAFHDQFAILDQNNNPIPCPPGSGNTCSTTPYGTLDRTANKTGMIGASLQATSTGALFGHKNHFVVGASVDASSSNFTASSELGTIDSDLVVVVNPAIPGAGSTIHTLGGFGYAPIDVNTRNNYYGIYALDNFDITDRLSMTAGGRVNIAEVAVSDQTGASPDLNSSQTYSHVNPVTGVTYKITPDLTGYFGYSQANRAPTPLEQSCSSASNPCLLEDFLVADPPLKQVVASTYEAGLRDHFSLAGGRLDWKAALYRTDSSNDIINVASDIQGRGFFQNVPGTRRQGIEASAEYRSEQWLAYAGYSLIDATYQFTGELPSPNNPMADANGNVLVTPGKRIPGIPMNQGKLGLDFMPTPKWTLGADISIVGSSYFVGDEANQNSKLPGYWVANLHTSYQLTDHVQIFGIINNLFNKRYALYGTYFDTGDVANVAGLPVTLTDSRTEVLGAPLSVFGGVRVTF
jgi:iron complex outermembrane receptor protein